MAEVEQNLEELGVDAATRPSLLSKVRRGELPDSSTGASEVASWVEKRDGGRATIYEYADGSRRIVGIRPVSSGVTPLVEDNCVEPEGAGFWVWGPCQIYSSDPVSNVGFTAVYVETADHEVFPAEIRRAYGKYCSMVGATVTCELELERQVAAPGIPARAVLDYIVEVAGGVGGGQAEIWLEVWTGQIKIGESARG